MAKSTSTKVTKIELPPSPDKNLIHEFEGESKFFSKKTVSLAAFLVIAGIMTGYFLATTFPQTKFKTSQSLPESFSPAKTAVGSADVATFRDFAEGVLEKDGINGEGTHRLIRPGGESQTVYLTSSVLDLDQFVGKKVRVWGETFAAKKAAWLMDVGRVEVL